MTFKIKFGLFITPYVFIAGGQMHAGTEPVRGFQPPRGSLAQYPDPRLIRQEQRTGQRGGCSRYPFQSLISTPFASQNQMFTLGAWPFNKKKKRGKKTKRMEED